jgi:siroheme synthase-like protein
VFYPVSLKVGGQSCLVVGGGAVALKKARALVRSGARVTAVSPAFDPGFRSLKIRRVKRPFRAADVRGVFLVISATDESAVNRAVHAACLRRRTLVNVVDKPELCTFIVPSVLRRGDVTVSISTGGKSPGLAQALRKHIERLTPRGIGPLARRIGAERARILRALGPSPERTRRLRRLVRGIPLGRAAGR